LTDGTVGRAVAAALVAVGVSLCVGNMEAQPTMLTVSGRVTSEASGNGIFGVSVMFGGEVVTATDQDGLYEFQLPVAATRVDIAFRRIGFRPHVEARDVSSEIAALTVDVVLVPVPTVLEEITVDGRRITIRNPGLVGFYERRELGYGRYLTEEEIDRALGFDMSNLFRRLRFPAGCDRFTPFVVYLDGVRVMDMPNGADGTRSALQVVNSIVAPAQVGGIELYADERSSQLPREFIPAGPYCGVAMFWTRQPKPPSGATLTVHLGSLVGRSGSSRFAVGGGFGFPLRSGSSLSFGADGQVPLERSADRWRVFIQATGRPVGIDNPWYIGVGAAIIKPNSTSVSSVEASPMIVTGLEFFDSGLTPFLELRILDPTSFDQTSAMLLTGIGVKLGSRAN